MIKNTLITDIKPVLNWRTPLPSLLGSKFCAIEYACSHTTSNQKKSVKRKRAKDETGNASKDTKTNESHTKNSIKTQKLQTSKQKKRWKLTNSGDIRILRLNLVSSLQDGIDVRSSAEWWRNSSGKSAIDTLMALPWISQLLSSQGGSNQPVPITINSSHIQTLEEDSNISPKSSLSPKQHHKEEKSEKKNEQKLYNARNPSWWRFEPGWIGEVSDLWRIFENESMIIPSWSGFLLFW